jgi:hypothetical protein
LATAELTRHDTVGALVRARVGHLESLGLATRTKDGVIFADDLNPRLDQLKKAQDVMRTHWAEKRTQRSDVPRQAVRNTSERDMQAEVVLSAS